MFTKLIISTFFIGVVFAGPTVFAQKSKPQRIAITLGERGYKPSSFRLRKGVPARITFTRTTDKTCGTTLLIPSYNISRDLPLNEPVTVAFTPRKTGTVSFTCGMNMLRGKIIVN